MENPAFEMQERERGATPSKEEFRPKAKGSSEFPKMSKPKGSMLRFFLLCLLASLITTAIGVLVLALLCRESPEYSGNNSGNSGNSGAGEEEVGEEKVEAKFQFLCQLQKAKVHKYPGGEIQWARFRRDAREYENPEVRAFGRSLHFHQSQLTLGTLRIRSQGLRAPHWHFNANEHGIVVQLTLGTLRIRSQGLRAPHWHFNANEHGIVVQLTLGTLRIRSQGLRAPHWHFNANEHGIVVQGKAWIGILGADDSEPVTFNASRGQVIFFPRNSLHWVKNVGPEELVLLLFFSTHQELLTLDMDDAFFSTPEDVAARALQPEGGVAFIRSFQKAEEDQAINLPENLEQLIHNSSFPQSPDEQVWRFFYDLPGIFQWARFRENGTGLTEKEQIYSKSISQHENALTLATLRILGNSLGAPHFHFNANEMGVVLSGCGLVGVITWEGRHSEFRVGVGDVVFFPVGSQHFIQSFCQEELRLALAYSTRTQLETLRMKQYFQRTADHILAQLFAKEQAEFQKIPKDS